MRIENNSVSSASQPLFGNRIRSQQKVSNNTPSINTAYRVEISNMAQRMLEEVEDDLVTFNSDALQYDKNMKLVYKQGM